MEVAKEKLRATTHGTKQVVRGPWHNRKLAWPMRCSCHDTAVGRCYGKTKGDRGQRGEVTTMWTGGLRWR